MFYWRVFLGSEIHFHPISILSNLKETRYNENEHLQEHNPR